MRGRRVAWPAIAAIAAGCFLALAGGALANPPAPADLEVGGGEDAWRSTRTFRLSWRNPVTTPPVAAVHYRVRDPLLGLVVGPIRLDWPATDVDSVEVPERPGAYVVEVWLEDAWGQLSPAAAATTLRFDDERPGKTSPLVGAPWLGRAAFPAAIRLSRPEPVPLSGIRGYAVSVAEGPGDLPCTAPDRCGEAETDLRGGIDERTYTVTELPEGTSYVRAVAVSGSGMASLLSEPAMLRVDKTYPVTTLRGAPRGWTNRPVELSATATDGGSGMDAGPEGLPPFTAISVDGAVPVVAAGAVVRARIASEGAHQVVYYARDLAGNVDDGGSTNGLRNPAPRAALVRIDRTTPTLSFARRQDPKRPELIEARVADPLSGPDGSRGWIGVRRHSSGDPFARLPGLPAPSGELRARWDSEAYPDGQYEFQAIGFDRAGNSAVTVLRADGRSMVLSNPLKRKTSLSLRFAAGAASRRAVAFGRSVLLRGRLAGAAAGSTVEVVERDRNGTTRTSSIATAADGRFAVRLQAGPSRQVSAAFGGDETLTMATSASLELAVRGRVRMGTSARVATVGGAPLLFTGRVSAAPGTIPAEGKTVELQFRLPGLPWTEFRTVRSDRHGRFRYRYRFSDDDSRGVRFLFRAYAPAQGGWPYEPAGSKPLAVRGR